MTDDEKRPTTAEQFAAFFTAAMPVRDLNTLFAPQQDLDHEQQEETPE